MRVPKQKTYAFDDLIRNRVTFASKDISDFIIIKSNGVASYNFAVTIDDHLMKITHVIRGEEHLTNTPKQLVIYEAFNWTPPLFGHLPLEIKDNVITQKFLAIQVKNSDECGYIDRENVNWQESICFENLEYNLGLEKTTFIKRASEFDITSYFEFNNLRSLMGSKFQIENVLLFLIKNDDTDLIAINDFIDDQFNKAGINEILNNFESDALELSTLQKELVLLRSELEDKIAEKDIFNSKSAVAQINEMDAIVDKTIDLVKVETKADLIVDEKSSTTDEAIKAEESNEKPSQSLGAIPKK